MYESSRTLYSGGVHSTFETCPKHAADEILDAGANDAGIWVALQPDQEVQCVHQALQGEISCLVGKGHQMLWAQASWSACCCSRRRGRACIA